MKKTIVFDFDGVIHSYKSGWQGCDIISDEPVQGIKETIDNLREKGYEVVIVSTRSASILGRNAMEKWLAKYNIVVDKISDIKPPALVYIDDRAITFEGNTDGLVEKICAFKSWTEEVTTIKPTNNGCGFDEMSDYSLYLNG